MLASNIHLPDGSHAGIASIRRLHTTLYMITYTVDGLHALDNFMVCSLKP